VSTQNFIKWLNKENIKMQSLDEQTLTIYKKYVTSQIEDVVFEFFCIVKKIEKYGLLINTRTSIKDDEVEILFARQLFDYSQIGCGKSFFSALLSAIEFESNQIANSHIFKQADEEEKKIMIQKLENLKCRLKSFF
jgi:hypothetical protein